MDRNIILLKLKNVIGSIEETTSLFYQQRSQDGYNKLEIMLGMLMNVIKDLDIMKSEGVEIGIDESLLIQKLAEAMDALEQKDTILLSDILQYEVVELLEKVMISIEK